MPLKQIEYLQLISELFIFKTIEDDQGNEYVLFAQSPLSRAEGITDRTAFEACENHMHLLNRVKTESFGPCLSIAKSLGRALLSSLQVAYPTKKFVVFVSMRKNDSLIIRFHQKWAEELPYYNPDDFPSGEDAVLKFE